MNVVNEKVESDLFTLQVCSDDNTEFEAPTLKEPGNNWNNVTVKNPIFRWEDLDVKTLAIKCDV